MLHILELQDPQALLPPAGQVMDAFMLDTTVYLFRLGTCFRHQLEDNSVFPVNLATCLWTKRNKNIMKKVNAVILHLYFALLLPPTG